MVFNETQGTPTPVPPLTPAQPVKEPVKAKAKSEEESGEEQQAAGGGGGGARGNPMLSGAFADSVQEFCEAEQRPYKYLFVVTAIMVFLSLVFSCCVGWKVSRGYLSFFQVHNAVTLALLFMSIYGMMQWTRQLSTMYDCSGVNPDTIQKMEAVGISCYNVNNSTAGAPHQGSQLPDYIWHNILACFYVGISFGFVAVGLLAIMAGLAVWGKYRDTAYGTGGPVVGGSGPRGSEPYYYSEERRRPVGTTTGAPVV